MVVGFFINHENNKSQVPLEFLDPMIVFNNKKNIFTCCQTCSKLFQTFVIENATFSLPNLKKMPDTSLQTNVEKNLLTFSGVNLQVVSCTR